MSEPIIPDELMNKRRVEVNRHGTYDVYLTTGSGNTPGDILGRLLGNRERLVITTPTVSRLHADDLFKAVCGAAPRDRFLILECSEGSKTVDQVLRVCRRAQGVHLGREGVLVAVGGGVCTDIVTVAASWLRRGINYVRVPTTLVGQVDAGIGIKGSLNLEGEKNYLGCFHPPRAALIEPLYLATLPRRHLQGGLAEVLKMAIIRDPHLFALVEANHGELVTSGFSSPGKAAREVLRRSINAMLSELETNIYEDRTHRRRVDLGHTISPILEAVCSFTLTHGEAVAIDISFCTVLARHMGMLKPDACSRILLVLMGIGLPIWSPELSLALCQKGLREAARHRGGKPNLVIPTDIGDVGFIERLEEIPNKLLETSIHELEQTSREIA